MTNRSLNKLTAATDEVAAKCIKCIKDSDVLAETEVYLPSIVKLAEVFVLDEAKKTLWNSDKVRSKEYMNLVNTKAQSISDIINKECSNIVEKRLTLQKVRTVLERDQ